MTNISPFADKEKLVDAIHGSKSKREIIERLGLRAAGGNYKQLEKYSELYNLELPVYKPEHLSSYSYKQVPNAEVFIENSQFANRNSIKQRLYAMGIKEECVECGLGTTWNGKPITLQLDHINGVYNDNRIENLAILCPNCHSQTPTYAGGRFKIKIIDGKLTKIDDDENKINKLAEIICVSCDKEPSTHRYTKMCDDCHAKYVRESRSKRYGVSYPDYDTLKNSIKKLGYVKAAAELGISDNALRAHMKSELKDGESLPKYISKTQNNKNNR